MAGIDDFSSLKGGSIWLEVMIFRHPMTDFMPWEQKVVFIKGDSLAWQTARSWYVVLNIISCLTQLQDLNHPKVREHQRIKENNFREQQLSFTIIYHPQFAGMGQLVIVSDYYEASLFQMAGWPGQRRGLRRFSQQNKFQILRRSSRFEKKNKNKIFGYSSVIRRLSLYTMFQEKKYLTSMEMATLAYSSGVTHQQVFSLPEPPLHTWW